MEATRRVSVVTWVAAGLLLPGTVGAFAQGRVALTDGQLDRISAGIFVVGVADAQSAGAFNFTQTTSNSFLTQDASPYEGQPQLGPTGGFVEGTAVAVGTNLGMSGQPPASSGTSVTTGGSAQGNVVINSTINQTMTGAGGVRFQAGWTFVYGAWIGL